MLRAISGLPVEQREAGQRDHGVAAPVAEPVIAGNDRFLVATGNDVLVGGNGKIADEGIVDGRRCGYVPAARDFGLPIFTAWATSRCFSGGNDRGLAAEAAGRNAKGRD